MSDLSDLVVQVKDWVLILGAWGVIPSRMQRKKVSTLGFGLTQQEGAAKSMLVSFSRQIVARSYSVQAGRWVSILILDVPKENISYLQDQLTLLPDCSCPSLRTCGPWRTFLLRSVLQQTVVKEGAVLVPIPRCSCADIHFLVVDVVQLPSHVRLCDPMDCSSPGFPVPHHLSEFLEVHVHRISDPSNRLILCHPLLLLPSVFPSIRVFSNELTVASSGQSIGASISFPCPSPRSFPCRGPTCDGRHLTKQSSLGNNQALTSA